MCIAMYAIGFPVGYVSCDVLCRASCRPEICKKTFLFSFRMKYFINSRPNDINSNSTTILCCMFVAMCGVCKSSGEALGALGQLSELWESFGSSGKPLGALPELWEL